jgi:hypothetical protein
MKHVTTAAVFFGVAFTWGVSLGGENDLQQQKYFKFWKPHAGLWKITIKEEGKDDVTGTFSYRPSPTKLSYIGRGKDEDGTPIVDGLYGYDPARKCWVDVEVFHLEGSYWFSTGLLRADVDRPLRQGSTVSLDVTEASEGETIKYKTTRVYKTLEKDRIVMVHQKRTTDEGKSLPDVTLTLERKK